MKKEVEKKLKEMMSDIFEVDISKINDLSNPDTIENIILQESVLADWLRHNVTEDFPCFSFWKTIWLSFACLGMLIKNSTVKGLEPNSIEASPSLLLENPGNR